ncbi:MAG: tetratricopeptide repeat protein [Bryobacteraceae bacterium]
MISRKGALAALLACLPYPAASQSAEYATPRVCAACHPEIARTYAETGMGRSFFRPSPANAVENFEGSGAEFTHALSDTHYRMSYRDGAYYQRRWQRGFDGTETNAEETKIDYVLGSGNHARSYLHRTARGTLIELPLGWYAEPGTAWGMNPGFDSRHPSTRRLISYECMFCHNGYPRIPQANEAPNSEPVFTGDLPEGIDCQRCHGPGARHVALAQSGSGAAALERIRSAILNPARLSPSLRMDLCMQCHLQPTSAAFPALIRRFGRAPFSFRPGEPLSAFLLAFDYAPGNGARDDRFEIVGSAAYRLRKSRCFVESQGRMVCETCHDPHERGVQRISACQQCHTVQKLSARQGHAANGACAGCHMPKRRTEDVIHAVMTDHWIQRRPRSAQELLAPLTERHSPAETEYHGEVVAYHPSPIPSADKLYLALAQVQMKNNLELGTPPFAAAIAASRPADPAWHWELGEAWLALGKPAKAAEAYQEAARRNPKSVQHFLSLAEAQKAAGDLAKAAATMRTALTLAPRDGRVWYQSAVVASAQGRSAEAVTMMRKAIELDATLAGAHSTLGSILATAGQTAEAEMAMREALRIDPCDASAWDLAGRLKTGKGDLAEGLYSFERAIYYRPDHGPYLYDYALALSFAGKPREARRAADDALRASPNLAEAHALLGQLLVAGRQLAQAAEAYRRALQLNPDFARIHLDLASVLAAQGDRNGAIQELRAAAVAADPNVSAAARQALERMGERPR